MLLKCKLSVDMEEMMDADRLQNSDNTDRQAQLNGNPKGSVSLNNTGEGGGPDMIREISGVKKVLNTLRWSSKSIKKCAENVYFCLLSLF